MDRYFDQYKAFKWEAFLHAEIKYSFCASCSRERKARQALKTKVKAC